MERLKPFIGRSVDAARLADRTALEALGFRARWIPEPLDEFDEIEVAVGLDGARDLLVTVAVEKAVVARILLGWGPAGDDDADRRGFEAEEIPAILEAHGEAITGLLSAWCPEA